MDAWLDQQLRELRRRPRPRLGRGLPALLAAIAVSALLVGIGVATGQRAASAPVLGASTPVGERAEAGARVIEPGSRWDAVSFLYGRSNPEDAPAATRPAVVDEVRFFDGRPIRPVRTERMRVTAYSPDARSCGASADGITASGYPVTTNAGHLVAADPTLLPLGSLVSVPGYDGGDVVPVLDVGGAIKGKRLDVLFPTHERAMKWGVQTLDVTIWEYADGKPSGFRRMRQPARKRLGAAGIRPGAAPREKADHATTSERRRSSTR